MENKLIQKLVENWNLTNLNESTDEYILTKDEEDYVIANELLSLKQYKAWKMKGLGYTDTQIFEKIESVDCEAELNKELILKQANSNKVYDLWQKEQRKKEKELEELKKEELKKTWTAKHMFRFLQWTSLNVYGKKLLVTDNNKNLITALCFFLSNDSRFETELGFSFTKGLLIRGTAGLGKTYIPKCLSTNELRPISVFSMIEISEEAKDEGDYDLKFTPGIIYIDDVGSEEPTVKHFGTTINWFKSFIEKIYLNTTVFNKLIISTNINFAEIENRYGFRVRSRMKDMFNIIDVTGTDMRGQN